MTLKEIFDSFNEIALKQPTINEIIKDGNIYTLNNEGTFKFGVFCAVQDIHHYEIEKNAMTYRFFLYYVDRLKSDSSNKIEIQSTAIQTLNNIIRPFTEKNDVDVATTIDYTPFTESFKQLCAGCYCAVAIKVYDDGCVTDFK